MIFDIRTPDAAKDSVYALTGMTAYEFFKEYVVESNRGF